MSEIEYDDCNHVNVCLYETNVWKCMVCRKVFIPYEPGKNIVDMKDRIDVVPNESEPGTRVAAPLRPPAGSV